jgi:hypothetical protein
MSHRYAFSLILAILFLSGAFLTGYHHFKLNIPLLPGEKQWLWVVDAKIEFEALNEAVKVALSLPNNPPGFSKVNQRTASPGYGLSFVNRDERYVAEWTSRQATGRQTLYYKVELQKVHPRLPTLPIPEVRKVQWQPPYAAVAERLVTTAYRQSADNFSFARQVIQSLSEDSGEEYAQLLLTAQDKHQTIIDILHQAKVPARIVKGLYLEDGRRRQQLTPFIQVFEQEKWQLFDPETAQQGIPDNLLLWSNLSQSILEVIGGDNSTLTFSMVKHHLPLHQMLSPVQDAFPMLGFSVAALPVEEQAMFKNILLIPIGVLIVTLMRVFVGLRTSGTFMPVLIAMAFIQTSLLTGVVGFVIMIAAGLLIRSYLSHLNLLLTARISAVIITVIILTVLFSLLSYRLGLTEGLKITFFPIIILSWTIERMSILWEEEGAHEVLVQGGGSLLVAVIAYMVMSHPLIKHLTFNFIGLQFMLLALIMVVGSYKGYRLLELFRFGALRNNA